MKKVFSKKLVREFLLFIILILLTFWLIFKDQNMYDLIDAFKSVKLCYVFIGIVLMLCYHLTEAYNVRSLLKSFGEEKISILKALKFTLIGFFFSSITPASSGGQPLEIYYMTKEKIKGSKATMSSLTMLCGFQISTITLGIVGAISNPSVLKDGLIWFFLLGLAINSFALTIMLICIFSQKLTKKLINIVSKILIFFKVKNADGKIKKIKEGLDIYTKCSKYIKSHFATFIKSILLGFVQISFYYSVPFCIYKAFGFDSLNYFRIFTMQAILFTSVSGIPLPGAVGISESIFIKIFEKAFGSSIISGAMLLSRGVTFYLYVVISLIVVLINNIRLKKVTGKSINVEEIDDNLTFFNV